MTSTPNAVTATSVRAVVVPVLTAMRLALGLALGLAACASAKARPGGGETALALTHGDVIDVTTGAVLRDRTVLIRDGRIAAVGRSGALPIPRTAQVIDSRGKYLIPGLWDMHVHAATSAAWHFPLFVALGITGVRNMHTTVDTALELTRAVKRRLADRTLLGPRFLANGAIVDGPVPVYPNAVALASPAAARTAVDSLAAAGADFIKVYNRLPRDVYFAIAEQAKRRGIPFVGHVPNAVRVAEAANAGQRSIEHADALLFDCSTRGDSMRAAFRERPPSSYEEVVRRQETLARSWSAERCSAAIAALRRNGTWFAPTLVIFWATARPDSVLTNPTARAVVPEELRREWATEVRGTPPWRRNANAAILRAGTATVAELHRAGIPLLAGTDLGNPLLVPGYSLHAELELLVNAGLTPLEGLQTATLNPARFLEATDSLGTIEPGEVADLVLLDANPLADIRNTQRISAVVLGGRLLTRTDLDTLLRPLMKR